MSSDLRFHIASLAAVFFALGIGIFVGTAFVGAPLVERQTRIVRRLEGSVADLQRKTDALKANEDALRVLLPGVVGGKLAGRRVLVVRTGAFPDAAQHAAQSLRAAGATVAQVALPIQAWRSSADGGLADEAARLAAEAARLAPLLASGNETALAPLRQNGRLTGDALDNHSVRLVVLVGGADEVAPGENNSAASAASLPRLFDVPLAQAWQAAGVFVVGTEPFEAPISFIGAYESAGLSTVDNIDRAAGEIALPFALRGEKASYGMKPTADRVLPASLAAGAPTAAAGARVIP